MKIRYNLIIVLALTLLAACQPADTQPVFSSSTYGAVTPIPFLTAEARVVETLPGRIRSFDISPNEKTIALATSQGIFLYDLKSYKNIHTLNKSENGFSVAWSPDGTKLAVGSVIVGVAESGKPHLTVWDTSSWKIIFEPAMNNDNDPVLQFGVTAWSPDSQLLATGAYDRVSSSLI